jgi:predicted aldo/keto reductase-like oxidoreductase
VKKVFSIGGKKVSLLGYGAMRMPTVDGGHANNWARDASKKTIDQNELNSQIAYLLNSGVNYFDTSPAYCRGESERRLGEALEKSGFDREEYIIATKLSNFAASQQSLDDAKKMLAASLKNLRTKYIDCYLLHSIGNGGFETFTKRFISNGALDWLVQERKKGVVRHLGFSYHGDIKTFEWCMQNHEKYKWDFAMIQMNYIDWNHAKEVNERNVNASYLYGELYKRGIPVVVMEPLLGGSLARLKDNMARILAPRDPTSTGAKWAFRFCASYPGVMCVLSGMTRREHMEENVRTFDTFTPCSQVEFAALERAAEAYLSLGTVPCTSCNYCMPCPYGLDIPSLLRFRNEFLTGSPSRSAAEILSAYKAAIPEPLRRADHCTGCGICRPACPQQIDISSEIAAIDRKIDLLKDEEARK